MVPISLSRWIVLFLALFELYRFTFLSGVFVLLPQRFY